MNPPAALYGAMSKDRKPFTYTPGGLDLSEIKSERMAKRLMRNAMNQGVPEVPIQQIQSPPATSNPISVPNFNCLPVQVFPAFNLPANPKSLLRTRSNPDHPREPPIQRASQPSQIPKPKGDTNVSTYSQRTDNSNYQRPVSLYEQNTVPSNVNTLPRTGYANNETTAPFLPEISYEAEYFQTTPRNSYTINKQNVEEKSNNSLFINEITETNQHHVIDTPIKEENNPSYIENNIVDKPVFQINESEEILLQNTNGNLARLNEISNQDEISGSNFKVNEIETNTELNSIRDKPSEDDIEIAIINGDKNVRSDNVTPLFSDALIDLDFSIQPLSMDSLTPALIETKPDEEESRSDDEQKVVKVVKKQVKKENKSEVNQNGDQNGDGGVEAALTVKLPTKKSAAKTETKVEVVKRQLPDGSIEEVQTTTTKTTVDGKTTISTKTETTIIPKEEEEEEEVEEEEEDKEEAHVQEVEENGEDDVVEEVVVKKSIKDENSNAVSKGNKNVIVTNEERSETQTTKKVTVIQNQESEVEEEEDNDNEDTKAVAPKTKTAPKEVVEEEEENEDAEVVEEEVIKEKPEKKEVKKVEVKEEPEEVKEEEEEEEEVVEEENQVEEQIKVVEEETKKVDKKPKVDVEQEDVKVETKEEKPAEVDQTKDDESEYTDEEYESEKEETPQPKPQPASEVVKSEPEVKSEEKKEPVIEEETKPAPQPAVLPEPTVPLREPSIPLEKVEDVEIKPISLSGAPVNETVSKTVTQNTEITTRELPTGPLSTQTEYNRIENTVTVNRTTKTLDHSYEQLTQLGVPTVKTYFPPNRERVSTSPQPSKPYQPVYPPTVNQPTERRHSLLLERLSTERQIPTSDIYQNYQYNNQSYEQQRQWSQEPQAEVLTVSNVKPSKITNQQWYQQNNRDNVIYNNVTPTTTPASQTWPQPPLQPQPSPQPQQQVYVQPQYQPLYSENTTNTYQQNNYAQAYTPKPSTWGPSTISNLETQSSNVNTQQNQYSYLNQNSSDSYQNISQQYSSSYVPPPWEQDSSYVVDTSNQNQYQVPPPTTNFTPSTNQGWNPPLPKSKFNKTPPTAYIPPAPNQSFVSNANTVNPPRVPGKKTYYSEYERRYITVPESNYVPGETKYQPQPDPSPQYYYDNNEPVDNVEPQWRKELREFTEKTSQTQQTETISVQPPWQEDAQYAKTPTVTYTPTPSWSQTLRPRTWRERSFESEYVGSQEFSKSNTLGRGRPLSSYGKSNIETIPERSRGVSVDRYNPNSYHSPTPAEHSPVQSHTMNVVPPAKSYHNPNVPAYHASRASAEPREQPIVYQQPRAQWGDRASPLQSRSFKYLQWITGTEN